MFNLQLIVPSLIVRYKLWFW